MYVCMQGKAPLLSLQALHDLHIFIFVLAVVHVVFSALTILFGSLQVGKNKNTLISVASLLIVLYCRFGNGNIGKMLSRKRKAIKNKVMYTSPHTSIQLDQLDRNL